MKIGKRHLTDGTELPNQILWNLGGWHHQTSENERLFKKIYLRRTGKQLETNLCSRNLIKGINTWSVPLVRYLGPLLKWTRDELRPMDQRTRKLMTMHKALHPRVDVDRLYVPRKEGGRVLASIEDSVDSLKPRLKDYIEKYERGLISVIRNNTANTIDKKW